MQKCSLTSFAPPEPSPPTKPLPTSVQGAHLKENWQHNTPVPTNARAVPPKGFSVERTQHDPGFVQNASEGIRHGIIIPWGMTLCVIRPEIGSENLHQTA